LTLNTPWIQQLAEAPLSERGTMLEAVIVSEVRARLLMTAAEELPLDESMFALGLTSIGAAELQQRLEAVFGRRVDSSSLFNNPTISYLLAYLRADVLADLFVGGQVPPKPAPGREAAASSIDPAGEAASGAQPASPKDLVNDLLNELYES
jgi:aryl carrier-like protein